VVILFRATLFGKWSDWLQSRIPADRIQKKLSQELLSEGHLGKQVRWKTDPHGNSLVELDKCDSLEPHERCARLSSRAGVSDARTEGRTVGAAICSSSARRFAPSSLPVSFPRPSVYRFHADARDGRELKRERSPFWSPGGFFLIPLGTLPFESMSTRKRAPYAALWFRESGFSVFESHGNRASRVWIGLAVVSHSATRGRRDSPSWGRHPSEPMIAPT
jgi:hypothetical protein